MAIDYETLAIEQAELALMSQYPEGFWYWLPHWKFKDRESGRIRDFGTLWEAQAEYAAAATKHRYLFDLKAGKLGATEIACAFDGYHARFGPPNARVHLFSLGQLSARDLLSYVRFGLDHLPAWLRLPIADGDTGSNTSMSLKLRVAQDDVRTIVSYPTTRDVTIDQTATHVHADEFTRWRAGEAMYEAILSTISPSGGSLHIVSRGNGPNWAGRIFRDARQGKVHGLDGSRMHAMFMAYDKRPGRGLNWYERTIASMKGGGSQFLPTTWQDALKGDESYVYPMWESPPGRHFVPAHPCDLRKNVLVCAAIDPGGTDPTAMGLYGKRSGGYRHKYAEWYSLRATNDDIEYQLAQWELEAFPNDEGKLPVIVPPDAGTLIATLEDHGFYVVVANNDKPEGIRLMTMLLEGNAYTVHDSCEETAIEYEDYRTAPETDSLTKIMYASNRTVKHHADCLDCDRYANMFLSADEGEPKLVTLPSGVRVYV